MPRWCWPACPMSTQPPATVRWSSVLWPTPSSCPSFWRWLVLAAAGGPRRWVGGEGEGEGREGMCVWGGGGGGGEGGK